MSAASTARIPNDFRIFLSSFGPWEWNPITFAEHSPFYMTIHFHQASNVWLIMVLKFSSCWQGIRQWIVNDPRWLQWAGGWSCLLLRSSNVHKQSRSDGFCKIIAIHFVCDICDSILCPKQLRWSYISSWFGIPLWTFLSSVTSQMTIQKCTHSLRWAFHVLHDKMHVHRTALMVTWDHFGLERWVAFDILPEESDAVRTTGRMQQSLRCFVIPLRPL